MSRQLLGLIAALGALALVSCGSPPSTADFVRRGAINDLYQIEAGKIASEKGQSDAVKQFGLLMVEAHGKSSEALRNIVQAEKLEKEMPSSLNRVHRTRIDALKSAPPDAFDRIYADQQAQTHGKAAKLFDDYAEGGDNAALKQFAANALPAIQQHLQQAKQLVR